MEAGKLYPGNCGNADSRIAPESAEQRLLTADGCGSHAASALTLPSLTMLSQLYRTRILVCCGRKGQNITMLYHIQTSQPWSVQLVHFSS